MTPELAAAASTFNHDTKQMYPSCQFAALNVYGPRQDWEVWGDFRRLKDAQRAAFAWGFAFKHNATMNQRGIVYRVAVKI